MGEGELTMDNSDLERWAEIRAQGFIGYLLKRTLFWTLIIVVSNLILNNFIEIYTMNQVINVSVCMIISTIASVIGHWRYCEKEYKNFINIAK